MALLATDYPKSIIQFGLNLRDRQRFIEVRELGTHSLTLLLRVDIGSLRST